MAAQSDLEVDFHVPMGVVVLLLLIGLLSGCSGGSQPGELSADGSTPCPSNAAQILVFDGLLQTSCGCKEGAGLTPTPPQPLNCTISSGTTVFFQYIGPYLAHQIAPTNGTGFPASPLFDPSSGTPIQSFTAIFNTPGSYPFVDEYNTAMNGVIVVQ